MSTTADAQADEAVLEAHDIVFRVASGFERMARPDRAVGFVPDWFKDLPARVTVDEELTAENQSDLPAGTAKACAPFQDAMTAGYIIPLPFQVFVRCADDGTVNMTWTPVPGLGNYKVIDNHAPIQLKGMGLEDGGIFKFMTPWAISLPEGFSALYTHPLNRPELPFVSFSGVVESDAYRSPVNIPFMWTGPPGQQFLDAGTPIAQVIPFRREDWQVRHEIVDYAESIGDAQEAVTYVAGYKRKFRKPKNYR